MSKLQDLIPLSYDNRLNKTDLFSSKIPSLLNFIHHQRTMSSIASKQQIAVGMDNYLGPILDTVGGWVDSLDYTYQFQIARLAIDLKHANLTHKLKHNICHV